MHLLPFVGLAATFVGVTTAERDLQAQPDIKYDETADWYKDHGEPVPAVASEITAIKSDQTYIVRLECPGCPFAAVQESGSSKPVWQERENSLLLKFDVPNGEYGSAIGLNNAPIMPLGKMPLYISAYQVGANTSQTALDSIIAERMLDPDSKWQPQYHSFPLAYTHSLFKNKKAAHAPWILQLDIQGLQSAGEAGEPFVFPDTADRRIVELAVREHRKDLGGKGGAWMRVLSIEDVRVVAKEQRAMPVKMKCGKFAVVETSFDPSQWDEFGEMGSWSHFWAKLVGKNGQYWIDRVQDNALLFPLALVAAFLGFFVRACYRRRQLENSVDAEYALLEEEESDDLPAYADIPEIKVEQYD